MHFRLLRSFSTAPSLPGWAGNSARHIPLLIIPAVTAYLALNFTGSTTFTSRTGVKKEIFRYVPGHGTHGWLPGSFSGLCSA